MIDIKYRISTFPSSEKFQIFKVINTHIWQVMSLKAYNIDIGEIEYLDIVYDDPVTAEIICNILNDENEVN